MNKEMPSYETQEEVMFFDTDIGGVVHNIAYLRMIETCRTKLATEKLNMDLIAMTQSGVFPVVLKTEIDYLSPATLGHKLTITGKLESVSKARFHCVFEIHADGIKKCLVRCQQSLAIIQTYQNGKSPRPQRIPQTWLDQWG